MKIFLSADQKIRDVRKEFEREFPYLKINFIRRKNSEHGSFPRTEIAPSNSKLIDISGIMKEGEIEISGNQTVAEVKQMFQSKFYLPVQVFRKICNGMIETSSTDHLTLAKQNRMGRQACKARYDEAVLL